MAVGLGSQKFPSQQTRDGPNPLQLRPDRSHSDSRDNEESDGDDAGTEARTASLGLGFRTAGTSSSLQCFLAEWTDDESGSSSSVNGAESQLAGRESEALPRKRRWEDEQPAGEQPTKVHPSKGQSSKVPADMGKKPAKKQPSRKPLEPALDVEPLNVWSPLYKG